MWHLLSCDIKGSITFRRETDIRLRAVRKIFLNSRGFRAGWRLLIFVCIFVGLGFLANWIVPLIFNPGDRPFLDPVGMIFDEVETLVQIIAATWIMARIERRRFADYGIPVRTTVGRDFWAGL